MAILIKSKVASKSPVAKVASKSPVAKVASKSPVAKTAREPIAKKFFLSKEVCALVALRGIDAVPAYWTAKSCHEASEIGAAICAEADKIKSMKMSPARGLYLVCAGPKGSRCVPIKASNGQYYERLRDGVTLVRGNAVTSRSHVGDVASCERWLKAHVQKGLTDFWRNKDGSKACARAAGFKIF